MSYTNFTYIPLPRTDDGSYDLYKIDVSLRFVHQGILNIMSVEWNEGLTYKVELPSFTFPFEHGVDRTKVFAAIRWLHEMNITLREITHDNLFIVDNSVVLYIGDTVSPPGDMNDENKLQNIRELTSLIGEDPNVRIDGMIIDNYDHSVSREDIIVSSSHRDRMKSFVNTLYKNHKNMPIDTFMRIVDIAERCSLIDSEVSSLKKILEVVPNIYFCVFDSTLATKKTPLQHEIERLLLINFGGVFYHPWAGFVSDKSSFKRYVDYIIFSFNTATYCMGIKVKGENAYHATLKDAFSKT